jgi:hypothetical protein
MVLVTLLTAARALYTDHVWVLPSAAALIGLVAAIFILPEVYGFEHD